MARAAALPVLVFVLVALLNTKHYHYISVSCSTVETEQPANLLSSLVGAAGRVLVLVLVARLNTQAPPLHLCLLIHCRDRTTR